MKISRLLLVTRWGWPFGGGEAFMKDSMKWCESNYTEILWLAFMNASTQQKYTEYRVNRLSETTAIIEIPNAIVVDTGCINANVLIDWMKLLDPDIVHHQGADRGIVLEVCQQLKVPMVSGFHFWNGVLHLSPIHQNVEMIKHIEEHQPDEEFSECLEARQNGTFDYYWASDFMKNVVQKVYSDPRIGCSTNNFVEDKCVYPIPSEEHALAGCGGTRNMITQINVHSGKGGHIFMHCMEHLRHIPFQCVITEPGSEKLYNDLKEKAKRRPSTALILERTDNIRAVYARASVVLIPSIVDETFCRVAFEAILNGIPVIASPAGYIKQMLEGCKGAVILSSTQCDPSEWLDNLKNILANNQLLLEMSQAAENHAQYLLTKYNSPKTLQSLLTDVQAKSRRKNIMIFAPWADQGLGVQARNYATILERSHYKVSIFSYKPYYAHQVCSAEWQHDRVYYSENIREKVTDDEIRKFVQEYDIGTALIPETCWFRVFEIANLLSKDLHVRVFAIPNVEILRKDELQKHQAFHGLLCNNEICMQVFENAGLGEMCHYVGYTVTPPTISTNSCVTTGLGALRFLCLGGMNAFSRKQIDQVCAAFPQQQHIQLTVTNQNVNESEMKSLADNPKFQHILFVWKALRYDEIMLLYTQCDVVIHVSKHEGLGIGFYEALSFGKPVITLDIPPHNEIIKTGVNGWLIPATVQPSKENTESPIGSAFFDPDHLKDLIQKLANNPEQVEQMAESTRQDYANRFDISSFSQRFIDGLRI